MTDGIPNLLLVEFSEFVAGHLGLHFPPERWADLQRGIRNAAREFGYADAAACVRWLMAAPLTKAQIDVLAGNLTVGETYFFRERKSFEALEHQILPEFIRTRHDGDRRLRFWSAACCTGEEAYSLAILLRRTLPDLQHWNVTILATDVNPRFLHTAAQGVFGEWSFRDAPPWLKGSYFTAVAGGRYEILPEIKRMVTFAHLNLARDVYPSLLNDTNAMDVILCRNVLMYFKSDQAHKVVDHFHRCLVAGGWLLLSATETSPALAGEFVPVHLAGAILYQKADRPPAAAPVSWPAFEITTVAPPVVNEPTPAPDRVAEAMALYERGADAEATVRLEALSRRQPLDSPAMMLLARGLANQGRLTEALGWCDRAVATAKLSPAGHYLRATILHEQGALEEAGRAFHRAIYLDHKFVLAHFALGNLARNRGRHAEADKHFTNALRLLSEHRQDDILPESDGITAGRLAEIIAATQAEESMA